MGCSSGKEKISIRQLKLKSVGIRSIDNFVDETEDVIERFAKLTDDIEKKRLKLDKLTGFPRDSGLRKSVLAILLLFLAAANGDKSKVKIELAMVQPFIKIKLHGVSIPHGDDYLEAIDDYLDEVAECVEKKIPKVLKEMGEMASAVAKIAENAADEIGELSVFEQASALAKSAALVGQVPKIVTFMDQQYNETKKEFEQL